MVATYNSVTLTSGTESITPTESVVATYNSVTLTSGTESITPTESVAATYNSVTLTSGTESVTSTDSVVGGKITSATTGTEAFNATELLGLDFRIGAVIAETITSTDSVVGRSITSANITEKNGEITPYAATLISVYQVSDISVLVTPFLNIDDTVNRS